MQTTRGCGRNAMYGAVCKTIIEGLEQRVLLSSTLTPTICENVTPVKTLGKTQDNLPANLLGKVTSSYWAESRRAVNARNPASLNDDAARFRADGAVQTYIHTDDSPATLLATLSTLGINIDGANESMKVIQAWVKPNQVAAIAQLGGVSQVELPVYGVTNTGAVNSAGDGILNASSVRSQFAAYGITGAGIKVGVISDGVSHVANSQASGDLPTVTINPSLPGNGDEGTAMLEIVNDLAPGAQLYFSGSESNGNFTSADMVNDINWLVSQGCNVIVDDMSFFDQPFFQDGAVANAAANAVTSNVVYVTSSGNYAQEHFQGQFAPYSSTTYQTFYYNNTSTTNLLLFPVGTGYVKGALEWSDAWGGSGNNYDLYLFGWNGSTWVQVASSTTVQSGSQNPYEFVAYNNTGTYSEMGWLVNKASGASRELEVFMFGSVGYYTNVTYTPTDTIFGQGAVSSVISCGAIDAANSGNTTIETYSSQGPTTVYTNFNTQTKTTRSTLDGCGIDGVQTKVGQLGYFGNPFYGTSAAAPHVAALAALTRQTAPTLTPAQVSTTLSNTAVDLTSYGAGYDNASGAGRFNGLDAVYNVFTPTTAPDLTNASDSGTSNTDNNTNITTPTFTGTVPIASFVRLYVDGVEKGTQQLAAGVSTYSIASSALTDGPHVVTIKVASSSSTPTANLSNASPSLNITIDSTPPVINASRDGATYASTHGGWNISDVIASYTASDANLVGSTTGTYTFSSEGAGQSHTFTATDLAGNSASATISNINIDKSAPGLTWGTASPAANAGGWNSTDVTVPYTATDAFSGVSSSTPNPLVLSAEGSGITGQVTVTDVAGNSAVFTSPAFNIDKLAPTDIAIGNASIAENLAAGSTVANFSTTDADAGDTFTYALVGGSADNSSFSIVGNQLKTAAILDYETKKSYSILVQTTDQGGLTLQKTLTINVNNVREASVTGRNIFYNNSYFDGHTGFTFGDPAANTYDDNAIAPDKAALTPGQTATFANYTSYSRGINGIMIDLAGFVGTLSPSDFTFTAGSTTNPSSWAAVSGIPAVTQRAIAGGKTRVTLIWTDATAVKEQWLKVVLKASDNSDVPTGDIFYFGNAMGESGNLAGNTLVNSTDELGVRLNPRTPSNRATITNVYDFTRDGLVNSSDELLVRLNPTTPSTALKLLSAPVEAAPEAYDSPIVGTVPDPGVFSNTTIITSSATTDSSSQPLLTVATGSLLV